MFKQVITLKAGYWAGHYLGELKTTTGPIPFWLVNESTLKGCKRSGYYVEICGPANVITKIPDKIYTCAEKFLQAHISELIAMSNEI